MATIKVTLSYYLRETFDKQKAQTLEKEKRIELIMKTLLFIKKHRVLWSECIQRYLAVVVVI